MANLALTTSVNALGTSNSWTQTQVAPSGVLYGTTPYLGASISSAASSGWSLGAITGGLAGTAAVGASSGIAFTSAPASWSAGTGSANGPVLTTGKTYNCTIYWTDASGVQQYALSVPMLLTISGTTYTWSCGAVSPNYASASLVAQSSTSSTVTNIIICPEVVESCAIIGDAASSNSITGLTVASARVGVVAFVGAVAAGFGATTATTTFTFGTVALGAVGSLTTSYSIVITSATGITLGTYTISGVGSLPTSVTLGSSPGTTGTAVAWYAIPTALASQIFVTQLVGPYNGSSWTGVYNSNGNPLYGLGMTARAAGAIITSTADTSLAVAPAVCAFSASS